jgi:hypothetical protein
MNIDQSLPLLRQRASCAPRSTSATRFWRVIRQTMGAPKSRDDAAAAVLSRFVEEMKVSGFVAEALERHGITGATVAPAMY